MFKFLTACFSILILASSGQTQEPFVNSEDSLSRKAAKMVHLVSGMVTAYGVGKSVSDYLREAGSYDYVLEQDLPKYQNSHSVLDRKAVIYFEEIKDPATANLIPANPLARESAEQQETFWNTVITGVKDYGVHHIVDGVVQSVSPELLTPEAIKKRFPIFLNNVQSLEMYNFKDGPTLPLMITYSNNDVRHIDGVLTYAFKIEHWSSKLDRIAKGGFFGALTGLFLFALNRNLSRYQHIKPVTPALAAEQTAQQTRAAKAYGLLTGLGLGITLGARVAYNDRIKPLWEIGLPLMLHGLSGMYIHMSVPKASLAKS